MIVKKPRSIFSGAHHTINPVRFRVTFQIESTANRCRTGETLRYLRPTFGFNGLLIKGCRTYESRTRIDASICFNLLKLMSSSCLSNLSYLRR